MSVLRKRMVSLIWVDVGNLSFPLSSTLLLVAGQLIFAIFALGNLSIYQLFFHKHLIKKISNR